MQLRMSCQTLTGGEILYLNLADGFASSDNLLSAGFCLRMNSMTSINVVKPRSPGRNYVHIVQYYQLHESQVRVTAQ